MKKIGQDVEDNRPLLHYSKRGKCDGKRGKYDGKEGITNDGFNYSRD